MCFGEVSRLILKLQGCFGVVCSALVTFLKRQKCFGEIKRHFEASRVIWKGLETFLSLEACFGEV